LAVLRGKEILLVFPLLFLDNAEAAAAIFFGFIQKERFFKE
jgi:hypothetical protein